MIAAGRDLMQGDKSPNSQNFNIEAPMCLGGKVDTVAERVRSYVYCSVASDDSIYPACSPFGLVFRSALWMASVPQPQPESHE